jgi:hypothetical protein
MKSSIVKLLGVAGPSFAPAPNAGYVTKHSQLLALLREKNGFFCFESALRIFPSETCESSYGLDEWNAPKLWRGSYGDLADGLTFFAEDIFGAQFCLKNDEVYSFDPETADLSFIGSGLDEWAAAILEDYDLLTGYSLAHEWQIVNGPLPPRERLMPKLPFVCGGEFELSNLTAIDAARSLRCRGNLATQIHSLPDGAEIKFALVD